MRRLRTPRSFHFILLCTHSVLSVLHFIQAQTGLEYVRTDARMSHAPPAKVYHGWMEDVALVLAIIARPLNTIFLSTYRLIASPENGVTTMSYIRSRLNMDIRFLRLRAAATVSSRMLILILPWSLCSVCCLVSPFSNKCESYFWY